MKRSKNKPIGWFTFACEINQHKIIWLRFGHCSQITSAETPCPLNLLQTDESGGKAAHKEPLTLFTSQHGTGGT